MGHSKILQIVQEDNGFEPIHWKYECQGLHLSESETVLEFMITVTR